MIKKIDQSFEMCPTGFTVAHQKKNVAAIFCVSWILLFLSFSFQHSSGLGNVFSSSKKKCKSSTNGRSLKPIWKHFWECSLCYVILTFCRFFFTYSGGCCCVVYIMQSLNKLALFHLPMFWFLYNGYGFGWGRGFRSSRLRVTFFSLENVWRTFFDDVEALFFKILHIFLVLLFF